jgi:hypothetical protein
VHYLQDLLRAAGHDPGPSDGKFGSRTASAVREFEQSRGIHGADGDVTTETWAWLIPYADEAYGGSETEEPAPPPTDEPAAEPADENGGARLQHAAIVGANFRLATLIQEDNLLWWQMENEGPGYVSANEMIDALVISRDGERITVEEFRNGATLNPGEVYGHTWEFSGLRAEYTSGTFDVELYLAMQPDEQRSVPNVTGSVRILDGTVRWL